MDNETLQAVVDEILPILNGKRIGKIFQLETNQLAIDFRPGDGRYLFLNFEPSLVPRLYLIRRRVRELEKESAQSGNFLLFARKRLSDGQLIKIEKDGDDRVVKFDFLVEEENGQTVGKFKLVAQLTGKAANLFLLDGENRILESLRETHGAGQEAGQIYQPPQTEAHFQPERKKAVLLETVSAIELKPSDFPLSPASPVSERLDVYFSEIETRREFDAKARAATARLRQELSKKEKLAKRLASDLRAHGEPEGLKKNGDLLLANLYTARRAANRVFVVDYFDENAPEIEIEAAENLSLQEAAEKYFARYSKARNAAQELTARTANLETEISNLKSQTSALEKIVERRDDAALTDFISLNRLMPDLQKQKAARPKSKKEPEIGSGVRRYRSSDGLEILVGRAAKDNDYLTFRIAKSLDWWMHTADYPGSHVVVRNPSKGELPPKTLLEAAELAAKFSRARADTKVAVNYALRKFVSKPKNAAPGLVRLASFRTILVEPKESGERILN